MDPHDLRAWPKTSVRDTISSDVWDLAPRLREADQREVAALAGLSPFEALKQSVENSVPGKCWTLLYDGVVVAIGGVGQSYTEGVGHPWLLGSSEIAKNPRRFVGVSKELVGAFQDSFPVLLNVVDARNTVHIRWLKWLGFRFIKYYPEYGLARCPFYLFVRIAPCV